MNFLSKLLNNTERNFKAAGRVINPFDGGAGWNEPKKPNVAPQQTIPAKGAPVPSYSPTGQVQNMPVGSSLFTNTTGTFYDPTGQVGDTQLPNSSYLRIAPYFKSYEDIQPKEYAPTNLNRLLGRR